MLYYVVHEPSHLQIFDSKWTSAKSIIEDMDKIRHIYDIEDIFDLTICGNKHTFKIRLDLIGYHQLVLNGRHFYADVSYGRSFVMPERMNSQPIRVYSNDELTKIIGIDINAKE